MNRGWTLNAVCAVLGNMQTESSINPGIWENLQPTTVRDDLHGYGLVQWTPWNKYADWAGANWQNNGDRQLERIIYESVNGIQWFYNSQMHLSPPITFEQFTHSELPIETLSDYWLYFYEHPGDPVASRQLRRNQTNYWYEYLSGHPYTPGITTEMLLILLKRRLKRVEKRYFRR